MSVGESFPTSVTSIHALFFNNLLHVYTLHYITPACTHIHIHASYIYIYSYNYSYTTAFTFFFCICVRSWARGIGKPMWEFIPGGNWFSLSLLHWLPSPRDGTISPACVDMSTGVVLMVILLGNYIVANSWMLFPCNIYGVLFSSKYPGPMDLAIFLLLFLRFSLSCVCRDCIVGAPVEVSDPKVIYSLHFNQLWMSVIGFLCC